MDEQTAAQESTLADKFLTDARERHADYWRILVSRVQMARRKSMSSTKQYADGISLVSAPHGSGVE